MTFAGVIATAAPLFNTIQNIPQLYKSLTTKSVNDLSIYSLLLMLTTTALWLMHGYFIMDVSLVVGGIIALVIQGLLVVMYFLYKKTNRKYH